MDEVRKTRKISLTHYLSGIPNELPLITLRPDGNVVIHAGEATEKEVKQLTQKRPTAYYFKNPGGILEVPGPIQPPTSFNMPSNLSEWRFMIKTGTELTHLLIRRTGLHALIVSDEKQELQEPAFQGGALTS